MSPQTPAKVRRAASRMRFLGLCCFAYGLAAACQSAPAARTVPVAEAEIPEHTRAAITGLIEDLYGHFCFDPGGEANWSAMEQLFVPGASFAGPIRPGGPAKLQGADGFLSDFREWIRTSEVGRTGLHERILRTRIDVFGNIAHAYVTFEGFVPGSDRAQTLGVDSLQLVLDRGEWKLASFTSQYASKDTPLPAQFQALPSRSGE